jgi:uncharacterized membrane protein YdfJ with MMPL/SSD domain
MQGGVRGVEKRSTLARLARLCFTRRWWVVLAWIAGTGALVFLGIRYLAPWDNSFAGGKSESQQAQQLIQQHFPQQTGDNLTLAIQARPGLDDPSVRQRVESLLGRLASAPHVVSVSSPYAAPNQVSADRKTAFATIQSDLGVLPGSEVSSLISDVRQASGGGVTFALGGQSVYMFETPYGGPSEGVGGTAAILVLLISFGSLLAMALPVVTALFGIGTGLAGVFLLGHLVPSPVTAPIVASLMGLGVGVDYALFIVTRYREGLAQGAAPEEATATALATAGKSVLFAGTTVVIAMLGLFVMQVQFINAMALAASLTVLMTMVASITLLPALLGFAGRNIDRPKLPLLGRQPQGPPLAERWARVIQRRPLLSAAAAAALLIMLALPALSMRLSFPDSSTQPHGTSGYQSHRILAAGFGAGYDAPLVIAAQLPSAGADLTPVVNAVRATAGVASVTPPQVSQDRAAALFVAYPTTGYQDAATPALVHRLREDVIPAAAREAGVKVYVGGPNAGAIDFADGVRTRLPWLIVIVVSLSLIVLLVLVRSVAIAVKAAVMNVLSIAAAYGVLTAIVQWGWLGQQLGFPTAMPIAGWVPLFMFPILFGLSTDYEVFLISRIREEHDRGEPTREAVTRGLARTARVITAAAAIMITVFLSNLLAPENSNKQFGLGLAIAVLIDATVVRMVLVPAFMELLGEVNWWLPWPLARLLPSSLGAEQETAP